MNRTASSAVLLLLGAAVVKVCVTGQYLRYVKAGLWPFLALSGVLLLVLALTNRHRQPKVAWLLTLPVLALLVVAPQPLGSYAAGNSGTALVRSDEYPPLPDGDPVKVTVLDYASRAVFDEGRSLRGRKVVLTGFTARGPNGENLLVRMILTCCAADGRPVKVVLDGPAPAPDTWVEVVGTYREGSVVDGVNAERIPFLEVESVKTVPEPQRPYE
ncbi:TIGR03943 family putative permease subunit [Saccharothrix variisporea]|uniref:Putative repeat protein (TIGR03943 family) n=1 Tax=Saccharothrix variisporea TaxID=543527 RepID=A0A495XJ62_9PSEU|nr:TIGR03943 family protein [Saccharothrix variisporea]RKT74117.1 putative repeat protein (TIGR03943 family) [Saccharothrix variisporea]